MVANPRSRSHLFKCACAYSILLSTISSDQAIAISPIEQAQHHKSDYGKESALEKPEMIALLGDSGKPPQILSDTKSSEDMILPSKVESSKSALRAEKHFERGLELKRDGDKAGALIEFLNASRLDPLHTRAYYEQSLIFREKKFHKLAISRLEQALAIDSEFRDARVLLAAMKLERGEISEAAKELSKTLGLSQTSDSDSSLTKESSDEFKSGEADKKSPADSSAPPMVLQTLHSLLQIAEPQIKSDNTENLVFTPKNAKVASEESTETKSDERILHNRKIDRQKSRKKIRKIISRRYKHNRDKPKSSSSKKASKARNLNYWLSKAIPWAIPFAGHTNTKNSENDLVPFQGNRSIKSNELQAEHELISKNEKPSPRQETVELTSTTETENNNQHGISEFTTSTLPVTAKNNMSGSYYDEPDIEDSYILNSIVTSPSREERREPTAKPPLKPPANSTKRQESLQSIGFSLPTRQIPGQSWLSFSGSTSTEVANENQSEKVNKNSVSKSATRRIIEDEWTDRLRELAREGTGSLKSGEAFMFSEDTGEAVLFLVDGRRIRRFIQEPADLETVRKERRPDTLVPKELFYDTALLGRIVGKEKNDNNPQESNPGLYPSFGEDSKSKTGVNTPTPDSKTPPPFRLEEIGENPNTILNWLKGLMRL